MGGAQEGKGQLEKIRANMRRKTVKIRPKKTESDTPCTGKTTPAGAGRQLNEICTICIKKSTCPAMDKWILPNIWADFKKNAN